MNRTIIAVLILSLVALSLIGCGGAAPSAAQATPTTIAKVVKASGKVIAEGKVVPVTSTSLAMPTAGTVAEVLVKEGDKVQAGAPLVRLTGTAQKSAITLAEASLKRAQAAKQKILQGPDENQVTAARNDLANADAALKQAQFAYDRAGGATNPMIGMLPQSLELERATNAYNAAKARLETLLKPTRAVDIAAADADINVAQVELDRAKTALTDLELKSPIAGTVIVVSTKVGEQVGPSATVVQIADLTTWEIQTTDLTEINIVRVREGDMATLAFDAIPDLEIMGKVTRIKALGENRQGDIVYTVTVKPDKLDERLRWNMTVKVSIEPK